jgi:hypothetical protein
LKNFNGGGVFSGIIKKLAKSKRFWFESPMPGLKWEKGVGGGDARGNDQYL